MGMVGQKKDTNTTIRHASEQRFGTRTSGCENSTHVYASGQIQDVCTPSIRALGVGIGVCSAWLQDPTYTRTSQPSVCSPPTPHPPVRLPTLLPLQLWLCTPYTHTHISISIIHLIATRHSTTARNVQPPIIFPVPQSTLCRSPLNARPYQPPNPIKMPQPHLSPGMLYYFSPSISFVFRVTYAVIPIPPAASSPLFL